MLGKDGQQVLIKHGGYYIQVHPCRLSPVETPSTTNPPPTTTVQEASQPAPLHNVEQLQPDSSSDDEATAIPPTPPFTPRPPSQPQPCSSPRRLRARVLQTTRKEPPIHQPLPAIPYSSAQPQVVMSDAALPLTPPCSQSSRSSHNPDSLHKNDKVSYKLKDSPTWSSGTLLQRSGKTTGMYKHSWNVLHPNQTIISIDFTRDIDDWK